MKCRHCKRKLQHLFLDLGVAPPSNALVSADRLREPEKTLPLRVFVCEHCWLVQVEDFAQSDDLFGPDYVYFSSVSRSWLAHAAAYSEAITAQLGLDENSLVVEVAANDGYLLKNFVARNIPCIGIEPTTGTAEAAEKLGIPVIREFFGLDLGKRMAARGDLADLVIGNNVYAHVPDINDFTEGLREILKPNGTITLEFPHLMRLIGDVQFDTVYHEHFSYLSLFTVDRIFAHAGLRIFDVEELATHGGSLRIFACHEDHGRATAESVNRLLDAEHRAGLRQLETYLSLQRKAERVRDGLVRFLQDQKHAGKKVAAYGAAAKGSTLLNFAGITTELLPFVCDAAASKQGKYLPGCRIPIEKPEMIRERKPDTVLILPWNIQHEITQQLEYIRKWGGKFAVAIPSIRVY